MKKKLYVLLEIFFLFAFFIWTTSTTNSVEAGEKQEER